MYSRDRLAVKDRFGGGSTAKLDREKPWKERAERDYASGRAALARITLARAWIDRSSIIASRLGNLSFFCRSRSTVLVLQEQAICSCIGE